MKTAYSYFFIILGDIFLALGLDLFLLPNKLSTGGFSGIATIINYYINIKVGTIIILLNVGLIIYAIYLFGFKFVIRTTVSIVIFGFFANYFASFKAITKDLLLASLSGGILVGLGVGINIRFFSTTGGSELLAKIFQRYFKNIKTSEFILIIDVIIIGLFVLVFRNIDVALYSIIAIYISTKTIDMVLEGLNYTIIAYIISKNDNELSKQITQKLERGVTLLKAEGYYLKEKENVIYCAISKYQLADLKNIIAEVDKKAFLVITQAKEVFGYGFK